MEHVIPEDSFNHIESFACGCNPTVVVSEGEESYIHNIQFNKLWVDYDAWTFYKTGKVDEQNTNK